ncbi:MAG: GNAT family N-acetyltransferase [Proteobacteria bacterium]|nr:GNAT family N-acetyltransferase [Pseudomonadota bacterium]
MSSDDMYAGTLLTDEVVVRSATEDDLDAIVKVDAAAGGIVRTQYLFRRLKMALQDGGIRLALVGELDGSVVGFVLAAVDYGEFGRAAPSAVLDALSVHPDFRGHHVAAALFRQVEMQLRALGIETLRTEVAWDQEELMGFFRHAGFLPAARLCLQKELA